MLRKQFHIYDFGAKKERKKGEKKEERRGRRKRRREREVMEKGER